jgi:hypothetical protein
MSWHGLPRSGQHFQASRIRLYCNFEEEFDEFT